MGAEGVGGDVAPGTLCWFKRGQECTFSTYSDAAACLRVRARAGLLCAALCRADAWGAGVGDAAGGARVLRHAGPHPPLLGQPTLSSLLHAESAANDDGPISITPPPQGHA